MTRRSFLGIIPCLALAAVIEAVPAKEEKTVENKVHALFPSQDPKLVADIVGAAHARIDRVKELVARSPALAKASWDWGFGDWESALGACSHTGRRDIAVVLLDAGARPDIFTFAMLGDLQAVKAMILAQPGIQKTPGPHGISLLTHAWMGGDEAQSVYDYLKELGDADGRDTNLEVSDLEKEIYVGTYVFGQGKDDSLIVSKNSRGDLELRRGERSVNLLRVGEHEFAPVGSPSVRVRFTVVSGASAALTIHDPEPIVVAAKK